MKEKGKRKRKGWGIALIIIIGFIGILMGYSYVFFSNFNVRMINDRLLISAKPKLLRERTLGETKENKEQQKERPVTEKKLEDRFSIKNNLMSIIIFVITAGTYIIIKIRSEYYVQREKD